MTRNRYDDITVQALKETNAMRKIALALAPYELRDKQLLLEAAILINAVRTRRERAAKAAVL